MKSFVAATGLSILVSVSLHSAEIPVTAFPPLPDGNEWTRLLQGYVDDGGRVDYSRWKANGQDMKALDRYLERFAPAGGDLSSNGRIAELVNAYNAFIVRAVLDRYPVDSVRSIAGVFTALDHSFGGRKVSLDSMEHTAVALGGYRVHAIFVCAAKSCPPLDRRAYDAATLKEREDERMRAWMARSDDFQFEPKQDLVRLPKYFDWYRADFGREGVPAILSAYAPSRDRGWLARGAFRTEFLEYDWRLNDQAAR